MTHLNTYQCVGTPKVKEIVSLDQWITNIQNSPYLSEIAEARKHKVLYVATKDADIKDKYDKIKNKLPTITYNSTFTGYRSTSNYISSTGYMYLDIDKPAFDIDTLDKSKIFIYYKSIGGLGYSILVKVNDLTLNNYLSTFEYIVNDLGIASVVDDSAKGMIQQSVISSDPNLYLNNDSFIYTAINEVIEKKTQPLPNNQKKEEHIVGVGSFLNVRYNNTYDFDFGGYDSISDWKEGYEYVECYLPNYQLTDKRKRTLLSYLTNLVWLNPTLDYYHYVNIMESANKKICVSPLPSKHIHNIVKFILKKKNEGRLKPIIKKRRILFAPHNELTYQQVKQTVSNSIRQKHTNIVCPIINDCIEVWDFTTLGKITAAAIAKVTKKNIKTIKKYYPEFKEHIKELNEGYKLENMTPLKKKTYLAIPELPVIEASEQLSHQLDIILLPQK